MGGESGGKSGGGADGQAVEAGELESSNVPAVPAPPPLEPTLSSLIVVSYRGPRDEAGRYHTQDPGSPAVAEFKGGHRYEGCFHSGMMHGQGIYTWADGTVYQGEFQWNVVNGKGRYQWADGSSYEGEVKRGLRHGQGKFVGAEGFPMYEGWWRDGVRHGTGALWYDEEKKTVYEGEWCENKRHGKGSMRWRPERGRVTALTAGGPRKKKTQPPIQGNLYQGDWRDDQKSGVGVMQWFDRRERYEGEWARDMQNGQGEHVWMDEGPEETSLGTQKQMCNRYVGSWKNGQRHGHGVFFYANGAKYTGQWAENAKDGYGVMVFEDGHFYEGGFKNDHMQEEDSKAPAKTKDDTLQPQIFLNVADLLPTNVDHREETLRLEKAVLRYTSELKMIYKRYSTSGGSEERNERVFAMTMNQFKRLWADCTLGSFDISLTAVYRMASAMRAQHHGVIARATLLRTRAAKETPSTVPLPEVSDVVSVDLGETDIFDASTPLLFREFVELLCRIAVAAYSNHTPRLSLAEAFKQLMTQAIQNNHSKPTVKGSFEEMICTQETKAVLQKHGKPLQEAFAVFASRDGRLSLGNFLRLIETAGMAKTVAEDGLGLSQTDALRVLVVGGEENPLASDPTLLEADMVWDEFLEALAHLSLHLKPAESKFIDSNEDIVQDEANDQVPHSLGQIEPFHRHLEVLLDKLDFSQVKCTGKKSSGGLHHEGTSASHADFVALPPPRPALRGRRTQP